MSQVATLQSISPPSPTFPSGLSISRQAQLPSTLGLHVKDYPDETATTEHDVKPPAHSSQVVEKPKRKQKAKQSKSRNGCLTCKVKRFKCDETHPACIRCLNRGVKCGGYKKDFKWKTVEEQALTSQPLQPKDRYGSMSRKTNKSGTFQFSVSDWQIGQSSSGILKNPRDDSGLFASPENVIPVISGNQKALPFHAPPDPLHQTGSTTGSFGSSCGEALDVFAASQQQETQPIVAASRTPSSPQSPLGQISEEDVQLLNTSVYNADLLTLSNILLPEPAPGMNLYLDDVTGGGDIGNESEPSPQCEEDEPKNTLHAESGNVDSTSDGLTFSDDEALQALPPDDPVYHDYEDVVDRLDGWTPTELLGLAGEDFSMIPEETVSAQDAIIWADPFRRLYKEPQLDIGSNEMLIARFFQHTCGIMSVMDTPRENPWRSLLWPLVPEYPVLFHAIASMACFHASKQVPALRVRGIQHVQDAIVYLQSYRNQTDAVRSDAALATTMALAFSESWDKSKVATGIDYIRVTKSLLHRTVDECRRKPRAGKELLRLKFLCKMYIYLDVLCRLTSVFEDVSNDVENVSALLSAPLEAETEIDPLMGCASTLFPIIGRVANLVRTVYRTKVNSPSVISIGSDLKIALENWVPPGLYKVPEDPSVSVNDSLQTAEAYRWATLLHLHEAVPELPSLSSAELASRTLRYLATVPVSSRAVIVHIYPLLVAGCEVTDPETRQWIRDRWHAMSQRMSIANIDHCADVVTEVWRRRDAYEANKALMKLPLNSSYISKLGCSIQGLNSLDDFPHLTGPFDRKRKTPILDIAPEFLDSDLRRESSKAIESTSGDLDATFSVRSRLHWVGVMGEWGWEVLLG